MSRNYECWRLKQKLQPAIDELTAVGFLKPMPAEKRFKRTGRGQWTVTFAKNGSVQIAADSLTAKAGSDDEPSELERELISRGVAAKTARDLIATVPEERIQIQLEQTDWLKKNGKRKIADLGGFLTQAIRDNYSRPAGFVSKAEKAERQRAQNELRKIELAESKRKQERAKQREEQNAQVQGYWNGLSNTEKEALKSEALAGADPEILRLYEATQGRRGSMAETLFRITIRNPYIRVKLGLPPEDAAE
jgi:hypothetical protein